MAFDNRALVRAGRRHFGGEAVADVILLRVNPRGQPQVELRARRNVYWAAGARVAACIVAPCIVASRIIAACVVTSCVVSASIVTPVIVALPGLAARTL